MWAFFVGDFMAIEKVNLATPGGDTARSAFTKINANFSNTDHAASRLVGTENGNVPTYHGANGLSGFGYGDKCALLAKGTNLFSRTWVTGFFDGNNLANAPLNLTAWFYIEAVAGSQANRVMLKLTHYLSGNIYVAVGNNGEEASWSAWSKQYGQSNTTIDGNGYIKPSSPVLRVFNDRIEGNTDGETMAATYTKNGVGDYTISGTTGLRTDGWYVVIPNDMNGNPKVAITLDDTDGVITLKTYVRIFDMTTFKFVPDLDQPLDIPDGRWIDLRFNDLPAELMPPEV